MKTRILHKIIFHPQKSGVIRNISLIPLKALGDKSSAIWKSKQICKISVKNNLSITESEDSAFFKISIIDTKNSPLEDIAYKAYKSIFRELKKRELNLIRVWNYVPDVLEDQKGIERYRRFNIGRKAVWEDHGPKTYSGKLLLPASTMAGCLGKNIILEAFASRYPVNYMENPLQVPVIRYSKKWGPKPPIFSRATLLFDPEGVKLFVSGTASILGEETVYINNPKKQTEQVLENIKILISAKNCYKYGYKKGFSLDDLDRIRVYIKNSEDFKIIKETVESILGKNKDIIYLQEEISRNDLLIEIEGVCQE